MYPYFPATRTTRANLRREKQRGQARVGSGSGVLWDVFSGQQFLGLRSGGVRWRPARVCCRMFDRPQDAPVRTSATVT